MDPLNDKELDQLLREWKAPPPPSLKNPLDRRPSSPWRRLFGYSIRIPLPVAAVGFALLVYFAVSNPFGTREGAENRTTPVAQKEAAPAPASDESKVQSTGSRPPVQSAPPAVTAPPRGVVSDPGRRPVQPAPQIVNAPAAAPRTEQAASLAGFQVVPALEPRLVRAPQ